ncbi:FAD-dependent monooxygenase [Actinosynnema sp. NPDC020468]|uniref:FAD-dependent monooxygenase n=1 Tax=Actinosynnema sp. NPDC020468 TaxID=3154488 RepID=UPI0033FC55A0
MRVEETAVVVVGAGVAGLTVASLLRRAGVDCVVVERRTRERVEARQRAGVLDFAAERVFVEAGLGAVVEGFGRAGVVEFRVDGVPRVFDAARYGPVGVLMPQQVLVRRLLARFLADGGDVRFGVADVALHGLEERPWVTYGGGGVRVDARYVAGCDGARGVGRAAAVAAGATVHRFADEVGWITVSTGSPPPARPVIAVSRLGFAAHFGRGGAASRFYLECAPGEDLAAWDDERVWRELRARLADPGLVGGPVVEKAVIDAHSFVLEPMSRGRLFLVGDAAHVVPPMGGKGMNLAVADAGVLARALVAAVLEGDEGPSREYSDTCLRRVWTDQEFSRWMTEMVFHGSAEATAGPFRHRVARARLDRLFTSRAAAESFAHLMAGTDG